MKAASFVMSIGAVVWTWIATRRKDVDLRLAEGSQKMAALDRRVEIVERAVQAAPGHKELHDLKLEVVKLSGSVERLGAVMEGNAQIMGRLENVVTRHENHLLESKR